MIKMDRLPFVDLRAQYQTIKSEIDAAIIDVLESSQFILGGAVESFEKTFASYCRSDNCVALNSGTSALHLALLAAGVGPGDEVITVPMTFVATVAAICYTGARPVLVDVDPITYTLDCEKLERAITPRTKAILPVHLHGQMADLEPIIALARKFDIAIIEDAAQAHGAEYKGRRAGSAGDIGCFSFYPGKNLGAYGDSGAVVTDNAAYAERIRLLRDWGQRPKNNHIYKGYNYRMDGIQGAILGVKMRYIEAWTEARRRIAARYDDLLANSGAMLPIEAAGRRHVYHVYSIRVPKRDLVRASLEELGVSTSIHYPMPVHMQPAYADIGYVKGDFPVSEQLAEEFLSLPIYPELTMAGVDGISERVIDALRSTG